MATAGAAVASGRLSVVRAADKSPNEKLNIAFVGVANKGRHNIDNLRGQNVVALCDVDANNLAAAAKDFPKATQHRDWRKMLDAEHKHIDAVVVSTPDHSHAGPTARAITLGKHVYCEKPLTHTVQEARTIARLAAKHKVVTQMGTQIHAESNYRRVVEIIQSGAIGQVRDVYTWCNKGWSDGRFEEADKPAYLDWDLWLGPAKKRSYCKGIHPFYWRCFWEYGSGTFGDMACHIMDLPFWALKLRYPTSVEAKGPPIHPDGAPKWVLARYEFPARGDLPAVNLHWSDGGKHHDLVNKIKDHEGKPLGAWDPAALFVGDKGMLAADYGRHQLLPKKEFEGFKPPAKSIPDSVGHWNEWVQACKTGKPTTCNFDYSGALTETVLLGVVAYRSGEKLQWDAKKLRVTNTTKAEEFLKQEYRKGWEVVGLS
jgi:predicted dehydrogenase